MTVTNSMIVMYNLSPKQNQSEFEAWLKAIDMPGYAKLQSMQTPVYYRTSRTLDGEPTPYSYIVTIEMTNSDHVEEEMSHPDWDGFVADFEARTQDAIYIPAERFLG